MVAAGLQPGKEGGRSVSNEIFEFTSVKTSDYEANVDTAIASCHIALPQDKSNYNNDAGFDSFLNSKV